MFRVRSERRWLKSLKTNKFAMTAGIVVILLVLMAIFAPWIAPEDPKFIDPSIRLLEPGPGHRFGTDEFGRDVLSRVIYGARVSLLIGASVTLFAAVIGSILGLALRVLPALRYAHHAAHGRHDGLPQHPARDRHHGEPRTERAQCLHRADDRLCADHRPAGARFDAGAETATVRGIGPLASVCAIMRFWRAMSSRTRSRR